MDLVPVTVVTSYCPTYAPDGALTGYTVEKQVHLFPADWLPPEGTTFTEEPGQ